MQNKAAWFWLQDGVVLSNNFYSLPFVVTSDLTQPEGFQFHIEGIALTKQQLKMEESTLVKQVKVQQQFIAQAMVKQLH